MGMFDEIYVNSKLAYNYGIKCHCCGNEQMVYQSKSLDSVMECYYLHYASDGQPKLYFMQNPDEKRMFEVNVSKSFKPVEIDPEWPHQWVEMYSKCSTCEEWNEWKLKFTDGVLQKVERTELKTVQGSTLTCIR